MAPRKRAFDLSAITEGLPAFSEEAPPAATRLPAFTVPIARAIETQHRNAMAELSALEAALAARKTEGLQIEEIDTALVDPSPYWDRDARFLEDQSFAEFVEDLRQHGQHSPALVRPHPTLPGRAEICFGHRRAYACRAIGRPLRAVIRELSEAQMAGAAYSENAHRADLSVLEQARSLARYVARGVFPSKQALADALGVSRPHVSNLTSFAEIPDEVLQALGDWRKCTFRDAASLLKATRDPQRRPALLAAAAALTGAAAPAGVPARLALLLGRQPARPAGDDALRDRAGRVLATRRQSRQGLTLAFTASAPEGLAAFVWDRLPALLEEFRSREAAGKPRRRRAFAANGRSDFGEN